jgi:hypothetical protein
VSERVAGWRVVRAVGVESEMELAYSGLRQWCLPLLEVLRIRDAVGMRRWLIGYVAISGYPKVNTYASAPGSRNVISSVRSRTVSCSRTSW